MTTYSPIVRALAALTPLSAESIAQSITSYRRLIVDRWRVGFCLNYSEATTWHAFNCTDQCESCSISDTGNVLILPKGASVVTDDNGVVAVTSSCCSCFGCGRVANVQSAWETLAASSVIPESWFDDDARRFVCETCAGIGGALAQEGSALVMRTCRDCKGLGDSSRPTTMPAMLALLAHGAASLQRAEELIRVASAVSECAIDRIEWATMNRAALDKHHNGGRATSSLNGAFSSESNRRDGNSWPVECDWQDEAIRAAWSPLREFAVGAGDRPWTTGFHLLYCFDGTAQIAVETISP